MLLGLADDPVYGPPNADGAIVSRAESGATQITFEDPLVIVGRPAPRAPALGSSLLDKVLPKKIGAGGKATIWGLPPAAAYALVAVILAGGGLMAYQAYRRGGGRRVALNPKRRTNSRGRRARYKR